MDVLPSFLSSNHNPNLTFIIFEWPLIHTGSFNIPAKTIKILNNIHINTEYLYNTLKIQVTRQRSYLFSLYYKINATTWVTQSYFISLKKRRENWHPSERLLKVVQIKTQSVRILERSSFTDFNIHHVITFLCEKHFTFVKITIILQM